MEMPIQTSKIDRNFLYSKKRTPDLNPSPRNYALNDCDNENDEKDAKQAKCVGKYQYIKHFQYIYALNILFPPWSAKLKRNWWHTKIAILLRCTMIAKLMASMKKDGTLSVNDANRGGGLMAFIGKLC
jgi:hypothetical protein